ncbi:hypothetical protein VUR80DRAFT_294 [Thermomyces stellatus]
MTSPATSDYNWSALGPLMEDDGEGRQAGTSSQAVSANAWPREGDEGEGGEGSNFWEGSRASDEGGSVRGAHRGRSGRRATRGSSFRRGRPGRGSANWNLRMMR